MAEKIPTGNNPTVLFHNGANPFVASKEINESIAIAEKYGAEVPFLRPSEISQDESTDIQFINHAIDFLEESENYKPDIILQLRPTQPLRKIEDINNCLDIFIENFEKYDSLRTGVEYDKSPFKMYTINDNKTNLIPLFNKIGDINEPFNQCRQYLPKTYLHNGYIDIIKTSILKDNTISGNNIYPYVMNKNDTIDIDNQSDWDNADFS